MVIYTALSELRFSKWYVNVMKSLFKNSHQVNTYYWNWGEAVIDLRMLHMSPILHDTCSNELWISAGQKINFELVIHCTSGTYSKLDPLVTGSHYLFLLRVTSYFSKNRKKIGILILTGVINTNHALAET
jgi:hypothetical protein